MTANGNTPLVDLWAERNRLLALANIAGKKAKSPDDVHELECEALDEKWSAIEGRIANTVAESSRPLRVGYTYTGSSFQIGMSHLRGSVLDGRTGTPSHGNEKPPPGVASVHFLTLR